jgi:hypothetical protein
MEQMGIKLTIWRFEAGSGCGYLPIHRAINSPSDQFTKLHMFQVSNLSMGYGNMGAKV